MEQLGASDFAELCEATPGDLEQTIHPLLGGSGIMGISGVTIWLIGVISILTKSP